MSEDIWSEQSVRYLDDDNREIARGTPAQLAKQIGELRTLLCQSSRELREARQRVNDLEVAIDPFVDWFKGPTVSEFSKYGDKRMVDCNIPLEKFRYALGILDKKT